MRLFIGIEFPTDIIATLGEYQSSLRAVCDSGRFKRQDNFHLTLKFLGEVPAEKVTELYSPLVEIAAGTRPFLLKIGKLGKFGRGLPIRVVWLDLAGKIKSLALLQQAVEDTMDKLGYPTEQRPWQPHITLAQGVEPRTLLPWGENPLPQTEFLVRDFILFLSEEKDRRRIYTPLRRFKFSLD